MLIIEAKQPLSKPLRDLRALLLESVRAEAGSRLGKCAASPANARRKAT